MIAYVKRISDFKTVYALNVIDSDVVLETSGSENTTITVSGENLSFDNTGDWIVIDGTIHIIDTITPDDGKTTIKCKPPINAFSRPITYTEQTTLSCGAYIAERLTEEYKTQDDEAFSMPYLLISNTDNTEFVAPETDDNGMFSVFDYTLKLRESNGVCVDFSVDGNCLAVKISTITSSNKNIVFSDGHAELVKRAFSRGSASKITTIQDGTMVDWYLSSDGSVSTEIPADRAAGDWIILSVTTNDDAGEKAREKFAKSGSSYKIEFWSDKEYGLFDNASIRIGNTVVRGSITYKGKKSGDSRYYYKSGELAVTLTDKLRG